MDTTLDLNELVMEAPSSVAPQRGEVILQVDRNPKGPNDVKIDDGERRSFAERLLERLPGRGEVERRILVRCGRSVAMEPLSFTDEQVTSEVTFTVSLKLDLVTPAANETEALRQLGFAFRDATLEAPGTATSGSPASTPSGRFAREVSQWLRNTYRSGDTLDLHAEPGWLDKQNEKIANWIRDEYGLNAIVNFKVEVADNKRLGPVHVTVETTACDSDKPLKFSITIGCELIEGGVFGAPALTRQDLERRTRDGADLFVRQKVTLQQYRFEKAWRQELKTHLAEDLKPFNRKISEFTIPLPTDAIYSRGPHAIRAGDAVFEPAGWNGKDKITFSGDAQIVIADAAVFETGRSHNDLLNVQKQLVDWLRGALQEAISEELHLVHDQRVGYADMLVNWSNNDPSDTETYKSRIEENLARRASRAGLDASTIIATPNRLEMGLLTGADISLEGLALPSKDPGAKLEFDASVKITINSFYDIRDLLNRTHDPLQTIKKEVVEDTLAQAARKISYLQFYTNFESGPWPDTNERADSGCKGWLQHQLATSLGNEKLELVSFAINQTSTKDYEVFKRLRAAAPQRVDIELAPAQTRDNGGRETTTPGYNVSFLLDITGLDAEQIGSFFREWSDFKGQNTEYGALLNHMKENFSEEFDPEDSAAFRHWEGLSDENREETEALVQEKLSEFLAKNFGLSGRANTISVKNATTGAVLVEKANAAPRLALKKLRIEEETQEDIARIKASSRVDLARIEARKGNESFEEYWYVDPEEHLEQLSKQPLDLPDLTSTTSGDVDYTPKSRRLGSQMTGAQEANSSSKIPPDGDITDG